MTSYNPATGGTMVKENSFYFESITFILKWSIHFR